MKTKKEPTLADRFLAANTLRSSVLTTKTLRIVQGRVRRAEKMVFDDAASYRVGEILRDIPELLVEQIQFARPPFEMTWIEYQGDALLQGLGDPRAIALAPPDDPTRDVKIGVMIDHNRVNVVSMTPDNVVGVLPIVYHLHTEWPLQDQLDFAEAMATSRMGIDLWFWGSVADKLTADQRRKLRDTNVAEAVFDWRSVPREGRAAIYNTTAGDFKNVIALLLLLNQPRLTNYLHVPRQQGWIGNKHRPFLAHHHITIALDAIQQIKLVGEKGLMPQMRRGGKVRGHYCHNETARSYARIAGCIHEWKPTRGPEDAWKPWPNAPLDGPEHWMCAACGGKRWWRDEHVRGDDTLGMIEHDYTITMKQKSA